MNRDKEQIVWMSHGDQVIEVPNGYDVFAKIETCPIAAYGNNATLIYGVQFHPEVTNTI